MAAPLTKENLDEINEALKVSKDVKAVIARAKTAGIEVEEIERTLLDNENRPWLGGCSSENSVCLIF